MDWIPVMGNANGEEGQGTVEYALIIGLVSVVMIGILGTASLGWINAIIGAAGSAIEELFA